MAKLHCYGLVLLDTRDQANTRSTLAGPERDDFFQNGNLPDLNLPPASAPVRFRSSRVSPFLHSEVNWGNEF